MLNNDQITFIIKDLNARGIVADDIQDEIIDHVCSSVEERVLRDENFIDAYHSVLGSFGHNVGLHQTQKQFIQQQNRNTTIMLKNYVTIAWRNLRKQGFYSLINVAGLAIGVAACLMIVLFINDELSYDKYNLNADRIFRTEAEVKFGGNEFKMTYRPAAEAGMLAQDFPEVESVVRFRANGSYLIKTQDDATNIKEQNVIWTDPTFFKIFSVNVLEGNGAKALADPASVAISKKMAEKYFPGTSALGQPFILDNKYHAKVTAVFENIPTASHFHFDILVSMVGDWPIAHEAQSTSYMNENFNEYILLKPGTDVQQLRDKLQGFVEKHMGPEVAQAFGGDFTFEKKMQGIRK
jgi:putative ABC transport system permease protein